MVCKEMGDQDGVLTFDAIINFLKNLQLVFGCEFTAQLFDRYFRVRQPLALQFFKTLRDLFLGSYYS